MAWREGGGELGPMGWLCTMFVVTLGFLASPSPAPAQEILRLIGLHEETKTLGTNEFPSAVWMAVISDEKGTRFLARAGDAIFQEAEPHPVGVVRSVTPVDLTIAPSQGVQTVRVFLGRPIPGARGLVLQDVVSVKAVEYRQRVMARGKQKTLGGDLYLVSLQGARAILQRDVDPPPPATAIMEQRLAAIKVVETAPRVWEIDARDVQNAAESAETILSQALKDSRLAISGTNGIGVEVRTPIADVRTDNRGFVVTSPNLASRVGLEAGDRIVGINGVPIDGVGDLLRTYRGIKNDPTTTAVTLTIERQTKPMSFTYRVR